MLSYYVPAVLFALLLIYRRVSRYTLKFTLLVFWYLFSGGFVAPFLDFKKRKPENNAIVSKVMRYASEICGLKFELRGAKNVNKEESCICIFNHQSSIDIIGNHTFWDEFGNMVFTGKSSLKYLGTLGLAAVLGGNLFIDRSSGRKAGQQLNDFMVKLKQEKTKLIVYPEGTRRNTGEIHQFKKGAFHAAIHAQVPILPVVNSSYRSFLDASSKRFDSGEIIVEVLPEIPTKGLTEADVDWLMEKTRNQMIEVFNRNSAEINERVQRKQR